MDRGSWHCTGDRDQEHPHGKEMQKSKMAVWGGLKNSCENKRSERRSNQSILKEISPGISLEGMLLKLKLQYFGTSCEELTHWKRLWCWEGLGAGGEGDDRGWDGWMASLTRWTLVSVNSGSWWWTGRPGMLQFMGSQRFGHDWTDWLTDSWFTLLYSRN